MASRSGSSSLTGASRPAFEEFCRIKEELEAYPVLNESDYSDREYEATLENYREELWRLRDELPEGWEGEVFTWFSDNGHDEFTENRDDQGGWAPREEILKALEALGLLSAASGSAHHRGRAERLIRSAFGLCTWRSAVERRLPGDWQ